MIDKAGRLAEQERTQLRSAPLRSARGRTCMALNISRPLHAARLKARLHKCRKEEQQQPLHNRGPDKMDLWRPATSRRGSRVMQLQSRELGPARLVGQAGTVSVVFSSARFGKGGPAVGIEDCLRFVCWDASASVGGYDSYGLVGGLLVVFLGRVFSSRSPVCSFFFWSDRSVIRKFLSDHQTKENFSSPLPR